MDNGDWGNCNCNCNYDCNCDDCCDCCDCNCNDTIKVCSNCGKVVDRIDSCQGKYYRVSNYSIF